MPSRTIEITSSQVKTYKACRRQYELSYIEMLKPLQKAEALEIGSSYHDKLEQLIKTGSFERTNDKTDAMALAFQNFIYPQIDIVEAEKEFKIKLAHGIYLKGKIDGIQSNGIPVEHKTAGVPPDDDYIYKLNWDEQVAIYMLALDTDKLTYTVCQKPTIRQKSSETAEEYTQRCMEWYDETKIRMFTVVRTKAELAEKKQELVTLAKEIRSCKHFYCNPSNCKIMRCSFASICLNYDPEFLIGYEKKARKDEELCG